MAIQTIRTSDTSPEQNYHEITTGNIVATLEMNQNAKGRWQPSIKIHFTSVPDMVADSASIAATIRDNLKAQGFQLADE